MGLWWRWGAKLVVDSFCRAKGYGLVWILFGLCTMQRMRTMMLK